MRRQISRARSAEGKSIAGCRRAECARHKHKCGDGPKKIHLVPVVIPMRSLAASTSSWRLSPSAMHTLQLEALRDVANMIGWCGPGYMNPQNSPRFRVPPELSTPPKRRSGKLMIDQPNGRKIGVPGELRATRKLPNTTEAGRNQATVRQAHLTGQSMIGNCF